MVGKDAIGKKVTNPKRNILGILKDIEFGFIGVIETVADDERDPLSELELVPTKQETLKLIAKHLSWRG